MSNGWSRDRTRGRFGVSIAVLAVLIAFPIRLEAQIQNAAQRRCIIGLNKAASKVAIQQQRQVTSCVKDGLAGLFGGLPDAAAACVAETTGRVGAAIAKLEKIDAKSCSDTPDFGYVGVAAATVVTSQERALVEDVFGDVDDALVPESSDAAAARCQATVAQAYGRLSAERVRAFVDCKKEGLTTGRIDSAAELAACLGDVSNDPKGRISKSFDKLARGFIQRCLDLPNVAQLFPGECATAPDFLTCLDERARCRSCLLINQVDNVDNDCERFDNGLLDGSCVDPSADECAGDNGGNNCSPNAACTDTADGFTCECDEGWIGDGVTCNDVNECLENLDDCDPNANCTNVPGSFTCACKLGFVGDGLICQDQNECAGEGTGHNCDANATCTNTPGGFACTCNPGWVGPGSACIDANECVLNTDNCSAKATCTNVPGSFVCACIPGFGGDGVTCVDFNECLGEGGGNNCHADAICTNLSGSFSCACKPGFLGDGLLCTDIDECSLGTDNCSVNATCANTHGSFSCTCLPGFGGNGVSCVDLNECAGENGGNNCSVNANCINLPGAFDCECRDGYFGNPVGGMCEPITVDLTSPQHGIFTTAGSIGVTGVVVANPLSDVELTIMAGAGPEVVVPINPDGTFSTTVPLSSPLIFNGIRAKVRQLSTGFTTRDRRVVIWGQSSPVGGLLPQSVALRINDTGFNELEPVLTSLVDLDINTLLPPGTVIINNECFVDSFLGCIIRVSAHVTSASLGSFSLDVNSQTNFVDGDIFLNNLVVNVQITGDISCGLRISASQTHISGDYLLGPDPFDNRVIDVNQNGNVAVSFSQFNHTFTSGVCDFPIIGDIIQAIVGDIQPTVRDGLINFLRDPDGGGSQDAPIAQAIEDALGDVELTGPIGEGFGVNLDTPLFSIPEDTAGITLASGAIMTPIAPAPGAPQFARTLVIPAAFPFSQLASATTPGGVVYDMALAVSDSAFNQILAAQVASGLLSTELSEIELVPGTGAQPINAGLLSAFVPEFGQLDPFTPLKIRITPTLSPVLTGQTGPAGEIAELVISHLLVEIVSASGPEIVYGELAGDLLTAFDLTVEPGTGNLLPVLAAPNPSNIAITLLTNPLGASEATLQAVIPQLLAPLVPQLSSLFGAFPIPPFLGLQPTAIEVSRVGAFMGVFFDAQPAP